MSPDVIFSNMSGLVSIFFQGFGNGYGFACNILPLGWAGEISLFFGYAWLLVPVEVSNDVNSVMHSGRVLTGKHRGSGWCAIGLGVGMGEAESLIGDSLDMGS